MTVVRTHSRASKTRVASAGRQGGASPPSRDACPTRTAADGASHRRYCGLSAGDVTMNAPISVRLIQPSGRVGVPARSQRSTSTTQATTATTAAIRAANRASGTPGPPIA